MVRIENPKARLSLFKELKKGTIDATWIFLPWEGTEAQLENICLNIFRTEDAGIPYGYSPVIARNAASGKLDKDALRRFVHATRKGYEMAMAETAATVRVMQEQCPEKSMEFLQMSQSDINGFYAEAEGGELGLMRLEKWQCWVDWLRERSLVTKQGLQIDLLFTNEFLS